MKLFQFTALFTEEGWISPAYVGVNSTGQITYINKTKPDEPFADFEKIDGYVLPGFQNAHSHAFQYGMAGMAETHQAGTDDDFWSWREAMYRCALSFSPDDLKKVALNLYRRMLKNGYTQVAEFHYLHHDKDGKPYANPAETGTALIEAASEAGIKMTLVPVFYQKGNFGTQFYPQQRRFISKTFDDYFKLLESSRKAVDYYENAQLGFGVHSMRAVDACDIIATVAQGPKNLPFHIHAAEQLKELEDCKNHLGTTPVDWLLDKIGLNERFHLVHCTHLTDEELDGLAKSKANVVLCPGTEGNLGDGIFRLCDFHAAGGNWSIGTDSHICLNPLEDFRWMDYAQRLVSHKRNTFSDGGKTLLHQALMNGRKAMGTNNEKYFSIGAAFDAVIYRADNPVLQQVSLEHLLPAIIYNSDSSDVRGTIVDGQWVVENAEYCPSCKQTSANY
ncbi:formimidoylglutamate deiminase [Mangrovibacterium diazotrophicum]|uniref:Formimidoylglutamate deiminase n=1 Tax=Mangrovibacterium diazotrophicum TaxID=1261403 RepID=A0A419W8P0_9BACT|nr:formimidoylglutamate deiminase [Mangrovibacterium diazotrophicum]RKD91838.1 formimidoylglutamate deiminase [Mangrovibacterium diazotrophicum]